MGFFSFKTMDTNRSISNKYSDKETFDVYMHDDKGNIWHESNYDGYGVFGGQDYFLLLAKMNDIQIQDPFDDAEVDEVRRKGIELFFSGDPNVKFPNLTESKNWQWQNKAPEICPEQGYFYD